MILLFTPLISSGTWDQDSSWSPKGRYSPHEKRLLAPSSAPSGPLPRPPSIPPETNPARSSSSSFRPKTAIPSRRYEDSLLRPYSQQQQQQQQQLYQHRQSFGSTRLDNAESMSMMMQPPPTPTLMPQSPGDSDEMHIHQHQQQYHHLESNDIGKIKGWTWPWGKRLKGK